ncbi:MAG: hypothetical protein COT74_00740 [Bdellovibrionales bacterium CG10_big_fil_rev_8_21_14_0_10_45_34]|nr:MAG: hypothetical protein COT74_00740 [Bdellovibrionales bacterium CG10_big_fil_rev_8_21_14_0_10_45_34]
MSKPEKSEVRAYLKRSPLQIEVKFLTELSRSKTFDLVTIDIPKWFSHVHEVKWNHANSENGPSQIGACSERECAIDGKILTEEIVEYVQDQKYSYHADLSRSTLKMPIRNHFGSFTVDAAEYGSLVVWRQYYQVPFWPLASIIRWYMRDKMMKPAVRNLINNFGGKLC